MHYRSIMILLVIALVAFGIYALVVMPKNEFPTVTVRQGIVAGVYPGATSSEVEEQLTKPLETFLWGFKEIKKKKTYSQSKDGLCIVFVELNDNVKNKDKFWSKFKIRLNQFKASLPGGVLALFANDDFGDTSALLITLESQDKTYRELHNYVTELEDTLRTIPTVSNLRLYGEQKEQINVYIDRDKLSDYGLNTASLLGTLSSQGMTIISGSVDDQNTVRPIHLQSSMSTEEGVANQIVYSDPKGNIIRLRDIAEIKREYPDPSSYIKDNGKKCVVLSLEMTEGHNIVKFGKIVKEKLANFKKGLPEDVEIYPITDQSKVVNDSVIEFLQELLIAILSVIVVIMLLLPLRVAGVAASTIPITIFISLGILFASGIEMNTVTLAAMLVTLGMIVDNSIVIIDCYVENLDNGMSRWHAASHSAKEFFSSIFAATLAISITFFPFLPVLKGMFHDFVKWFPMAVCIVLFVSLLVAVFVVPYMQFAYVKKGLVVDTNDNKKHRKSILEFIQCLYNKLIAICFKHPFYTLGFGILSIILGALLIINQPQKFLPVAERDQFAVEIYLPSGSSLERTAVIADSLSNLIRKDDRVVSVTTFYGSGSPRFQFSYAPQVGGSNFAQFIVNTKGKHETVDLLDKFTPMYTDYFSDAKVRFKQLEYTDAKAPIEMRFKGDDLKQLHAVADSAMRIMRNDPDLLLVRSSFNGSTPGMKVVMDDLEANRLGINKTLLSMNLATRFGDGIPMTTVWEGDYPVKVMLKDKYAGMQTPEDLRNSTVSGIIPGISVPLRQVAKVEPDWTDGQIVRRNGVRTVTISADLARGKNTNIVTDRIIEKLKSGISLPSNIKFEVGGQRENDNETQPQIYSGLALAVVIMFLIILFHFKNIRLTILLMLSLLFSLLGTSVGLFIMGQPMSLTCILGVVSLMGIIIRNGIILIDYAEELRIKHRMSVKHAIMQAAERRMRPIFLTSAAASMGVIPMVIANTPLWGPMGVVVCFGTIISMFFIITMIPVGYWMVFRIQDHKRILKNEGGRFEMMRRKIRMRTTGVGILLLLMFIVFPAHAQNKVYSLSECRKMALENNYLMKKSRLQIDMAKQQKKEAFTKYFPIVSANGSYLKSDDDLIQEDLTMSDDQATTLATNLISMGLDPTAVVTTLSGLPSSYSLGFLDEAMVADVMAIEPLFAGRQIVNGNKLANLNKEVKEIRLRQTSDQIIATTEKYYNQLLSLYEKLKTLDIVEKQLDRIHQDAQNAYDAGIRNKNDVLTVELKQNEIKSKRLKVENGIRLVHMLLGQYIGKSNEDFEIDRSIIKKLPEPSTYLTNYQSALSRLNESILLDKNVEAKELQKKMEIGKMMPSLAVGVGGLYQDYYQNNDSHTNLVGFLTVKIPISDLWSGNHSVKRLKLSEETAKYQREDNRQLLVIRMQNNYNKFTEAYQQVKLSEKAKEKAEENLRLNKDYYESGTSSMSDLLNAQTLSQQSKDQYTDAVLQYLNARTAYLQSTGRVVEF